MTHLVVIGWAAVFTLIAAFFSAGWCVAVVRLFGTDDRSALPAMAEFIGTALGTSFVTFVALYLTIDAAFGAVPA